MQNRVVKLKPRKPVWDRVARSALVNCTDNEWLEVIVEAQDRGFLSPNGSWMRDIVAFNDAASKFDGTVRGFIESLTVNQFSSEAGSDLCQ